MDDHRALTADESALLDVLVAALAGAIARELPQLVLLAADLELAVYRAGDPPVERTGHPTGQSRPGLRSLNGGQG